MAAQPTSAPRPPRIHRGELLSATSALALLALMLFFKWYGTVGIAGRFPSQAGRAGAESAWQTLTVLRWLMLATIAAAIVAALLHAALPSHGTPTAAGILVGALGAATTALLAYRVLIDLPAADRVLDQKAGALLALLAAAGIALGGYDARRNEGKPAGSIRRRLSRK
ncbi:MAG: hypothetical protein ACR2IP_10065 [Solirubrobacteraceae bacterium]